MKTAYYAVYKHSSTSILLTVCDADEAIEAARKAGLEVAVQSGRKDIEEGTYLNFDGLTKDEFESLARLSAMTFVGDVDDEWSVWSYPFGV